VVNQDERTEKQEVIINVSYSPIPEKQEKRMPWKIQLIIKR
jgi:hypothetical protein